MKEKPIVDLAKVAQARAGLDATIKKWPELSSPEARERLAAYLDEEGDEMAGKKEGEKVQIGVRLDEALIARLDKVASKLSRPGLAVTRTDAVRIALLTGLEAIEKEK